MYLIHTRHSSDGVRSCFHVDAVPGCAHLKELLKNKSLIHGYTLVVESDLQSLHFDKVTSPVVVQYSIILESPSSFLSKHSSFPIVQKVGSVGIFVQLLMIINF